MVLLSSEPPNKMEEVSEMRIFPWRDSIAKSTPSIVDSLCHSPFKLVTIHYQVRVIKEHEDNIVLVFARKLKQTFA